MSFREPIRKKNFSPLSRKSDTNPLLRRRFQVPKPQKPVVRRSPEEQKAFLQQKLEQSAFVGYNGLNVPVNVPQTPPPQPVQEKPTDAGLEDNAQQPEVLEAEATETQEEETIQPKEGSEAELSQNPESPDTEVDGVAVTPAQPSAAESGNNPSQKPNLQAQLEKVSRSSSNLLNIPVKAPGKEPPSMPEAETTSEQGEETIQREEVPEENVSQNPESPETEVEGEAVTSSEPSAADSGKQPSQKPNLQAQRERASRLSSNLLNIPVNTQGERVSSSAEECTSGWVRTVSPQNRTENSFCLQWIKSV